jgi:hypothetical protein
VNKKKLHLQKMLMIAGGMPRFQRMGKCNQCGQCCLNEDCEHLTFLENGKAFCNSHDNKRPLKCKLYPEYPPILFKTCGYYFWDIVDKRRLNVREIV